MSPCLIFYFNPKFQHINTKLMLHLSSLFATQQNHKAPFVFVFLLLFMLMACQSSQNKTSDTEKPLFNEDTETAAIMEVIDHETKSFFDGDYQSWAKSWSHSSYAVQAWNNSDGTADAAVGWDAINAQGKNWIETYYKNNKVKIHPAYKRTQPSVTFLSPDAAYLIWTQYNADAEKKYYRLSHESRLMQKEKDGWKIVNVSAFWDIAPKIAADSLPSTAY